MSFLFHPDRVARLPPFSPRWRRTCLPPRTKGAHQRLPGLADHRQGVYRLLANPHYPHLREGLRAIDNDIRAGMSLKELRNEVDRGNFGSFLAEALVADHFLQRGLTVSRGGKTGKPDLEIGAGDFTATVEVYSPRNWQARGDWLGHVIDALKNADIPYEYAASVSVSTAMPMHSDDVEAIINETGAGLLQRLSDDIAGLTASASGTTWTYDHASKPMTTSVELLHVADNRTAPVRMIGSSPPGDLFQADKEFDDLLDKIVGKASQKQASQGAGEFRGLAVDASRSGVDDLMELGRLSVDQWLPKVDLDQLGLDFIAVSIPRRGCHGRCAGYAHRCSTKTRASRNSSSASSSTCSGEPPICQVSVYRLPDSGSAPSAFRFCGVTERPYSTTRAATRCVRKNLHEHVASDSDHSVASSLH